MGALEVYHPRDKEFRSIHTYPLSYLIYATLVTMNCNSYLELGCGYGGVMLMAGMALDDTRGTFRRKADMYWLWGIDTKQHRLDEAEKILSKYRFKKKLIHADAEKMDWPLHWKQNFDVIFIDCGEDRSQNLINLYAERANKAIFVHDVLGNQHLDFPDNFTVVRIPEMKSLVAYNTDYTNKNYKKIIAEGGF